MPISQIEYIYDTSGEEIGLRAYGTPKGTIEFFYSSLVGNGWSAARLQKGQQAIQAACDIRTPLSDPSLVDDPWGPNGSDPALPWAFWDGSDLIIRPIIIEVYLDTAVNQPRVRWIKSRNRVITS